MAVYIKRDDTARFASQDSQVVICTPAKTAHLLRAVQRTFLPLASHGMLARRRILLPLATGASSVAQAIKRDDLESNLCQRLRLRAQLAATETLLNWLFNHF